MSNHSGVKFVVSAYRTLLYLYPIQYRQTYEEEMLLTFGDTASDAYQSGGSFALLGLSLRTFANVITQSLRQRVHYFLFHKQYAGIEGAHEPISGVRLFLWASLLIALVCAYFSIPFWDGTNLITIFFILYFCALGFFIFKKYPSRILVFSLISLGVLISYIFSNILVVSFYSLLDRIVEWLLPHASFTLVEAIEEWGYKLFFILLNLLIGVLIIRQIERKRPAHIWQRLGQLVNDQSAWGKNYFKRLFLRNLLIILVLFAGLFYATALSNIRAMGSFQISMNSLLLPLYSGIYYGQQYGFRLFNVIGPMALLVVAYLVSVIGYFSYGITHKNLFFTILFTGLTVLCFTFLPIQITPLFQEKNVEIHLSDSLGYQIQESCAVQDAEQGGQPYSIKELKNELYIPASAIPATPPSTELCKQYASIVKNGVTYQGLENSVTSQGIATNFNISGTLPAKINLAHFNYWEAVALLFGAEFALPIFLLGTLVLLLEKLRRN